MKDAAAIAAQLVDVRNVGQHKCVKLTLHVPAEQAEQVMDAFGWPTMVDPVPVAVARLVQPAERTVVQDTDNSSRLHAGQEQHVGPSPDKTRPALESLPALVRAKASPQKRLAQLAGMLAKDPLFYKYLESPGQEPVTEDEAAEYIRKWCGVTSRSQILPDTVASKSFLRLYDSFAAWRDADQYVEAS